MNRNHAIDLWKFVCALCLRLYHFKQVLGSHVADTYYDLIMYFNLVVEWFFMISGYMVCVSDSKWFKTAPLEKPEEKRFLYRFRRLYPMFFIATIAAAVIMYIYKSVTGLWWWEEGMQHGILTGRYPRICRNVLQPFQRRLYRHSGHLLFQGTTSWQCVILALAGTHSKR